MPFSVSWHTLLEELDGLSDGAELITPLSHNRFRITDVQEHRVVITFEESGERHPLKREQFETLYRRIQDSNGEFELDRLPADADPYPAVLSLHSRFEIDSDSRVIVETEGPTETQLIDGSPPPDEDERLEPDGLYVCEECGLAANSDLNAAENMRATVTPSPAKDWSNGCLAQPSVRLFDKQTGRVAPQEQVRP